jgi:hypothetical protein
MVQVKLLDSVEFWISGRWHFYDFCEDFPKVKEQQKTAKATGVVCFGDKIFTLSIDCYFLMEGGSIKS